MFHRVAAAACCVVLASACARDGKRPRANEPSSNTAPANATSAAVASSSAEGPGAKPAPVAQPVPHGQSIDVRYVATEDAWQVQWSYAEPTPGLLFDRRTVHLLDDATIAPALTWGRFFGRHTLTTRDKQPRLSFAASFPGAATAPEHAPFLRHLANGGRMIDLVTVAAHALVPSGKAPRDWRGAKHWTLTADKGLTIRVGDRAADSRLGFEMTRNFPAAYAYVGPNDADLRSGMRLFAADDVPEWLLSDLDKYLQLFMTQHAEWTGMPIARPPNVFVSWTKAGKDDFHGRARSGDIVLDLVGPGWASKKTARTSGWRYLMAHESFHLWNAHLKGRNGRWLAEGAAEYAALMSQRKNLHISGGDLERRLAASASLCLVTSRGGLNRPQPDNITDYACGATILFLADHATRTHGGVFKMLGALYKGADPTDGYTVGQFQQLFVERSADSSLPVYVDQLLRAGFDKDGLLVLKGHLERAGLKTRTLRRKGSVLLVAVPTR